MDRWWCVFHICRCIFLLMSFFAFFSMSLSLSFKTLEYRLRRNMYCIFKSIKNSNHTTDVTTFIAGKCLCVWCSFVLQNLVGGLLTFMHMNFEDTHCLSFLLPWIYLSMRCSSHTTRFSAVFSGSTI